MPRNAFGGGNWSNFSDYLKAKHIKQNNAKNAFAFSHFSAPRNVQNPNACVIQKDAGITKAAFAVDTLNHKDSALLSTLSGIASVQSSVSKNSNDSFNSHNAAAFHPPSTNRYSAKATVSTYSVPKAAAAESLLVSTPEKSGAVVNSATHRKQHRTTLSSEVEGHNKVITETSASVKADTSITKCIDSEISEIVKSLGPDYLNIQDAITPSTTDAAHTLDVQGKPLYVGLPLPLFKGCNIWINGRTEVDDWLLKQLIIYFGGVIMGSPSPGMTHAVADNLALGNSKWSALRERNGFAKKYCVVTSKWLIDSIRNRKRLCESSYMPQILRSKQQKHFLENFWKKSVHQIARQPLYLHAHSDHSNATTECQDTHGDDTNNTALSPSVTATHETGHSYSINTTDPDFIESYCNHSRLHFLGTWKEHLISQFKLEPFVSTGNAYKNRLLSVTNMSISPSLPQIVFHIDFDAFFVSVALKKHPELINFPVAVGHSVNASTNSKSEIASCNYISRRYGVRNGMWIGEAKALCPNLQILSYDFDDFRASSLKLMEIVTSITSKVFPASCDEVYMQLVGEEALAHMYDIAKDIRGRIYRAAGCTVSIGIGENIMLAKLAGIRAKPYFDNSGDGIFHIKNGRHYMIEAKIKLQDLPGVGWKMNKLLSHNGWTFCEDVINTGSKEKLQRCLGFAKGNMVWNFCHGEDPRPLPTVVGTYKSDLMGGDTLDNSADASAKRLKLQNRIIISPKKVLSISINWGVRLFFYAELLKFFWHLARECHRRMYRKDLTAQSVGLKILTRVPSAPVNPSKFLGTGKCHEMTRSLSLGFASRNPRDIYDKFREIWDRFFAGVSKVSDIRGVTALCSKFRWQKGSNAEEEKGSEQLFEMLETKNATRITELLPAAGETHCNREEKRKSDAFKAQNFDFGRDSMFHENDAQIPTEVHSKKNGFGVVPFNGGLTMLKEGVGLNEIPEAVEMASAASTWRHLVNDTILETALPRANIDVSTECAAEPRFLADPHAIPHCLSSSIPVLPVEACTIDSSDEEIKPYTLIPNLLTNLKLPKSTLKKRNSVRKRFYRQNSSTAISSAATSNKKHNKTKNSSKLKPSITLTQFTQYQKHYLKESSVEAEASVAQSHETENGAYFRERCEMILIIDDSTEDETASKGVTLGRKNSQKMDFVASQEVHDDRSYVDSIESITPRATQCFGTLSKGLTEADSSKQPLSEESSMGTDVEPCHCETICTGEGFERIVDSSESGLGTFEQFEISRKSYQKKLKASEVSSCKHDHCPWSNHTICNKIAFKIALNAFVEAPRCTQCCSCCAKFFSFLSHESQSLGIYHFCYLLMACLFGSSVKKLNKSREHLYDLQVLCCRISNNFEEIYEGICLWFYHSKEMDLIEIFLSTSLRITEMPKLFYNGSLSALRSLYARVLAIEDSEELQIGTEFARLIKLHLQDSIKHIKVKLKHSTPSSIEKDLLLKNLTL